MSCSSNSNRTLTTTRWDATFRRTTFLLRKLAANNLLQGECLHQVECQLRWHLDSPCKAMANQHLNNNSKATGSPCNNSNSLGMDNLCLKVSQANLCSTRCKASNSLGLRACFSNHKGTTLTDNHHQNELHISCFLS